jgi:hypothetical protein
VRRRTLIGRRRTGPPEDFVAFIERRAGDLTPPDPGAEPDAGPPTHHGRLTAGQRDEVLVTLARHWWWLGLRARRLGRPETADDLLDRLLAEHLAHWDPTAASLTVSPARPRAGTVTVLERPPTAVDLAGVAWREARRSRSRRGGLAAGTALLAALLLISAPRHSLPDAVPTGPPPVAHVTVRPPLTDVIPTPDRLAALPVMSVPGLPGPRIDLGTLGSSAADGPARLSASPVRRATAAFEPDDGSGIYVLGDDGKVRLVDVPVPVGARLTGTSLSPDGLNLALLTGNEVVVVSLGTRAVYDFPVRDVLLALATVWLSPTAVAVSDDARTFDVDLTSGTTSPTNFTGGDLLQAQPPGPLAELISADGTPAAAEVQHWSGLGPVSIPLGPGPGMSLAWLGAWQGPGWQSGGMLVRDAATVGLALPKADSAAGVAAGATLVVDEVTGQVRRVLAFPGNPAALAVLGFLDPGTVLLRAGDETSFGIISWSWGTGELHLVTRLSRAAVVSLAVR